MHKKNVLIIICIFLFLVSSVFVSAVPIAPNSANTVAYWALENLSDSTGTYTLTNNGATSGASGIINNSYDVDNTDYLNTGFTFAGYTDFTIAGWVYMDTLTTNNIVFNDFKTGTNTYAVGYNIYNANKQVACQVEGVSGQAYYISGNNVIDTGAWYFLTMTYTSDTVYCYVNANLLGTDGGSGAVRNSGQNMYIGYNNRNGNNIDGRIDEVSIFDYALSQDEIDYLYNSGSPTSIQQYPFTSPTSDNFTITAKNIYDSSSILSFSVNYNGVDYYTSNGTVVTDVLTNDTLCDSDLIIYNATNIKGVFFNKTINGPGLCADSPLDVELIQAEVRLDAKEIITNNSLNGTFKINGTTATEVNYLSAGTYNFSFTNASYYQKDLIYNVTALFNGTITVSDVYNSILNVTVSNAYSGALVNNFTGWIANTPYSYNETFLSSSSSKLFYLPHENFSVYVENSNYAINNTYNLKNINVDSPLEYLNFTMWTNNSIRITIKDEATNNLITNNITVTVGGSLGDVIYYTTTGSLFIENLLDGEYNIKFSGGNYTTRTYLVTVADRSTQILNAILTQETETTIFAFSESISKALIEGLSITMYRQINGTWTVIESKFSDITGRVQFTYTPNIKYKFYATKTGYTSKEFILDPILFSSYNVEIKKNQASEVPQYQTIGVGWTPKVFVDDEQNNFTFYISDVIGSLEVYGYNITYPGGYVSFDGTNANGETNTVNFNISGSKINSTVILWVYYDTTLGNRIENKYEYSILNLSISGTSTYNIKESYGLGALEKVFIAVLVVIVVAGMGTIIGGSLIGGILGILLSAYFSFIGFIPPLSLVVVVIVGFLLISKRSSD